MKQTVLITGASSGIGYEMARIFAHEWYNLVLVARDRKALKTLEAELPRTKVIVIVKDLAQPLSSKEIYEELHTQEIRVDILVNNAGFGDYGYFHEIDIEKEKQMIDLNVKALTELTYLFGRDMVKRGRGKILNVASTAAFQPGPLMSVYFATKHYVLAFSEGIAEEWEDFWVQVMALCPGPTETRFVNAANAWNNKMFSKKLPTAREVAQFGYDSLIGGKRVAIHGFMNRVTAQSVRFMPRNLITKMIKMMQEK
jgi:uncharacterized protein